MSDNSYIKEQLGDIQRQITAAAQAAQRDPAMIKLIAVSKTFPASCIETAYNAGQRLFGENRIQELEEKVPALPADIQWHMIGHLQGNKAAKAVALADYIHSVDSMKLLQRLDRLAGELKRTPKILLEVNISGEESNFGLERQAVSALAKAAKAAVNLQLAGLMTMAPFGSGEEELRRVFSGLRRLRDELNCELDLDLRELSMGMSNDFHIAVEEGATFVRIGTAIFGRRG